jgi:hypothetical protein
MTFATLITGLLTFALLLMVLGWAADLFQALYQSESGPHRPDRDHDRDRNEVFYARGRSVHESWADR